MNDPKRETQLRQELTTRLNTMLAVIRAQMAAAIRDEEEEAA